METNKEYKEFEVKVQDMRTMQIKYFATGSKTIMKKCKVLEQIVDDALAGTTTTPEPEIRGQLKLL